MSSWEAFLQQQQSQQYYADLMAFIAKREQLVKVYPPKSLRLRCFEQTPLTEVKVVILGQDPYHGEGQADGLSFSVGSQKKIPPSLRNIYRELCQDLSIPQPNCGDLISWASQGVLLLNTVLTVEEGRAGSHQKKGWEEFTDQALLFISQHCSHVVYILWGKPAQKKEGLINLEKNLVIKSAHPSPLSAYRGFFGSQPFSRCNDYLKANGREPIDWSSVSV